MNSRRQYPMEHLYLQSQYTSICYDPKDNEAGVWVLCKNGWRFLLWGCSSTWVSPSICDSKLRTRLCCLLDSNIEPEHPEYLPF